MWIRGKIRKTFKYVLACICIVFFLEGTAHILTRTGVLKYLHPFYSLRVKGSEDWRLSHAVADPKYVPDVNLFWKPKQTWPYNVFGVTKFISKDNKSKDVFQIIIYGDSNTKGNPSSGWVQSFNNLLAKNLNERMNYQIINRGVSGYSSYQGMTLFKKDVQRIKPDIVFVSFGWNDAAPTYSKPDKAYTKSFSNVIIQYILSHSRLYQTIGYYIYIHRPFPEPTQQIARVSIADYIDNMQTFVDIAHQHNVTPILLTHPHKKLPAMIHPNYAWRYSIPQYNESLRVFARQKKILLVDVQKHFIGLEKSHFSDECHFNAEGSTLLAKLIFEFIVANNSLKNN